MGWPVDMVLVAGQGEGIQYRETSRQKNQPIVIVLHSFVILFRMALRKIYRRL